MQLPSIRLSKEASNERPRLSTSSYFSLPKLIWGKKKSLKMTSTKTLTTLVLLLPLSWMLLFTKELPDWLNWIIDVAAAGFGLKNKFSVLEEKKKKKNRGKPNRGKSFKGKKSFLFRPEEKCRQRRCCDKRFTTFFFLCRMNEAKFLFSHCRKKH